MTQVTITTDSNIELQPLVLTLAELRQLIDGLSESAGGLKKAQRAFGLRGHPEGDRHHDPRKIWQHPLCQRIDALLEDLEGLVDGLEPSISFKNPTAVVGNIT